MKGNALDRILPDDQFGEHHKMLVRASRHEVWRALRAMRRRAEHTARGSQA